MSTQIKEEKLKFVLQPLIFEILPNTLPCPLMDVNGKNMEYVSKEYCDSFSFGTGCMYKKTCETYKGLLNLQLNEKFRNLKNINQSKE